MPVVVDLSLMAWAKALKSAWDPLPVTFAETVTPVALSP